MTERGDLELALDLANTADRITMGRFHASDLIVETKPDLTPVTEADRDVEAALRTALAAERPDDGILGEEFGGPTNHRRLWIIDPIDGTKNYVRGVPVWATLIGLAIEDTVTVGVVSAPALGRRWWAAIGAGAWVQDPDGAEPRRLSVSRVHGIADASFSFSDTQGWTPGAIERLTSRTWRQRAFGDFWSHVLVAEGAVDIAAEPQLAVHDVAAIIPIVQEAGGTITGFAGDDPLRAGSLLTTNGALHEHVLGMLSEH